MAKLCVVSVLNASETDRRISSCVRRLDRAFAALHCALETVNNRAREPIPSGYCADVRAFETRRSDLRAPQNASPQRVTQGDQVLSARFATVPIGARLRRRCDELQLQSWGKALELFGRVDSLTGDLAVPN